MCKKRLKLNVLTINSFITNLSESDSKTIEGGIEQGSGIQPAVINNKDTSAIENCTPHGTIRNCPTRAGCPFNSWDVCKTQELICRIGTVLFC